jgi:hypothetical protein
MNQIIDVVIPAHKKDLQTLEHCIAGIRRNITDVRRIIVVSKEKYTDKAEWFDEVLYPFSYSEVSDLVGGENVGWNLQQLLKLYATLVIPDISENVLVIDADTVFYRKVRFFEDGIPLYNLSKDKDLNKDKFHMETLSHIKEIMPEISENLPQKYDSISGICHHMLFQRKIIKDLMQRVEKRYGEDFYKAFLKNGKSFFGVAEYNLYFYFLVACHSQDFKVRILKYKNTVKFSPIFERLRKKYDYCSYHSYMRK